MEIIVKGKSITLKRTFRSLILFENITDKAFAPSNLSDILTYFFCVVLASEPDIDLTFDEFVDILDEKPELLEEFQKFILRSEELNKSTSKPESKKKEKKPKS